MQPQEEYDRFRYGVISTLLFIGLLWFIHALVFALEIEQSAYGIQPRTLRGALGILTSPLMHADYNHLIGNSIPLIALGLGLFYFYRSIAHRVFIIIYLLTGCWVWLMARSSSHIGASGLVYGMVSFMLFSGIFRRDMRSVAISLVVILLYGGMAEGLVPNKPGISWESHLLGAIAGLGCAFIYRLVPMGFDSSQAKRETENPPNLTHTGGDTFTYHYEFKADSKLQKRQDDTDHDEKPGHLND